MKSGIICLVYSHFVLEQLADKSKSLYKKKSYIVVGLSGSRKQEGQE